MKTNFYKNPILNLKIIGFLCLFFSFQVASAQQHNSSIARQVTDSLFNGQTDAKILHLLVDLTGTGNLTANQFSFNTTGTGIPADIIEARLYYLGGSTNIDVPLNINDTVGSPVSSPNGNFSINTFLSLAAGRVHNFVLTYDIEHDVNFLDTFDAQFTAITLNKTGYTPDTINPAGNRMVSLYGEGTFCRPVYTNVANYQIGPSRVVLGNVFDRRSLGSNILDFDKTIHRINRDTRYSLDITVGPINPEQVVGWVDWNSDGYFETNEQILSTGNMAVSTTYSTTLNVPCNITPGYKRMRLISDYGLLGTPTQCAGLYSGEAEDYILYVVPDSKPIASFKVDTSASLIYENSLIELTNTTYAPGSRMEYEWDVDNDGTYDSTSFDLLTITSKVGQQIIKLRATFTACDNVTTYDDIFYDTLWVRPSTQAPVADFIADRNIATLGERVTIKDISDFGPLNWDWKIEPAMRNGKPAYTFVNGTDANSRSPQLEFAEPGFYSVSMDVSNKNGSDRAVRVKYLNIMESKLLCPNGVTAMDTTSQESGILYDDGGPNANYSVNLNCQLLISPRCAEEVHIDLDYVDISPFTVVGRVGDFLRIWDGTSVNTGIPLHRPINVNGIQAPLTGPANFGRLTAESGNMVVELSSDDIGVASGIRVRWSITPKLVQTPVTQIDGPDTAYINSIVEFTSSNKNKEIQTYWDMNEDELPDALGSIAQYKYTKAGIYMVSAILEECGSTDTFRKQLVVLAPQSAPTANFTTRFTTISTSDTLYLKDLSTEGPTLYEWSSNRTNDIIWINGTDQNSKNPVVMFKTTGNYTFTLKVTNSLGNDTETKTNYITVRNYCTPSITTPANAIGIIRVVLENIVGDTLFDNQSANNRTYIDYSGRIRTTMAAGSSGIIHVSKTLNTVAINRAVWIDLNGDGSFSNNEMVAELNNSSDAIWTDTFTISSSAVLGLSRMRVAANTGNATNNGCGPHAGGEFEDYALIIQNDFTAPSIFLTDGEEIIFEECNTWVDPGYRAIDNVDGDITSRVAISGTVNTSSLGEYNLTYSVMDAAGNSTVASRKVTVVRDFSGPEIEIIGNQIDTIEVFSTYQDQGFNATDNCSGVANSSTQSSLNTNEVGVYYIVYSSEDNLGNKSTATRTIYVLDRTLPILSFSDSVYVEVMTTYDEGDILLSDNYDVNISYTRTGAFDNTTPGIYELIYSTTDASGNGPVIKTRYVEVDDRTAPELVFGYDTINVPVGTQMDVPVPIVFDNYDPKPQLFTVGAYDYTTIGDYTINYYAEDALGNRSAQISLVVRVYDDIAPTLELNGDLLIEKCRWDNYTDEGVKVSDNYNEESEITVEVTGNYDNSASSGYYTLIYTATDESNNSSKLIRYIRVFEPQDKQGCATSISEVDKMNFIDAFPNPAQTQFTVLVNLPSATQTSITLSNMLGQVVRTLEEGSIQSKAYQVDASNLPAGIYYLNMNYLDKTISQKVVISR